MSPHIQALHVLHVACMHVFYESGTWSSMSAMLHAWLWKWRSRWDACMHTYIRSTICSVLYNLNYIIYNSYSTCTESAHAPQQTYTYTCTHSYMYEATLQLHSWCSFDLSYRYSSWTGKYTFVDLNWEGPFTSERCSRYRSCPASIFCYIKQLAIGKL